MTIRLITWNLLVYPHQGGDDLRVSGIDYEVVRGAIAWRAYE
jgi:hypothetical protein